MKKVYLLLLMSLSLLGCGKDEENSPVIDILPTDMNVKAEPFEGGVRLTWRPSANWLQLVNMQGRSEIADLARVEIFQAVGDTTDFKLISTLDGETTHFTVDHLPGGPLLYYKVVGYLPNDNDSSRTSIAQVVATVANGLTPPQLVLKADFFKQGASTYYFQRYAAAPDYSQIALEYMSSTGSITRSLWAYNVTEQKTKPMQSDGSLPAWSPSGEQIAFLRNEGTALSLYQTNTQAARTITTVPYVRTLRWSPDGQWLAYHSQSWQEGRKLTQVSLDGTRKRIWQLALEKATIAHFAYSVNGEKLWVLAQSAGKSQLFQVNTEGTDQQLAGEFMGHFQEVVALSTSKLLFINDWAGYPALWQVDLTTREWRQLTGEQIAQIAQLQWNPTRGAVTFVTWLPQGGRAIMALPL